VIKNNIVWGNDPMSRGKKDMEDFGFNVATTVLSNNLCGTTAVTACAITTNPMPTFLDAQLADLTNHHDFHLTINSPAVDQGTDTITASITYSGTIGPFKGKAPDIGAYESVGVVTSPTIVGSVPATATQK
jgi:hypothetical protein